MPIIFGALLLIFRKAPQTQAIGAVIGLSLVFAAEIGLLLRVINEGPFSLDHGALASAFRHLAGRRFPRCHAGA